ncbi:MAG: twin-arginine translocation signal domain-containing protein, partial [Thermoguttaceae bacterium]|nr:twin-arginine translocation signal domain-containing protein [Thermoguttaceae bacterium]
MDSKLNRRQFVRTSAAAAAVVASGLTPQAVSAGEQPRSEEKLDTSGILNYNPDMEYRRCGRTDMVVSAVALGGHWKRVVKLIGGDESP